MKQNHALSRPIRVEGRRLEIATGRRPAAISVVIPAMNEAKSLPWVLRRMPACVTEIVLVDGNSTDDTVAVARAGHATVRVVGQHARGKGAALAAGLLAAVGDIVVMIDADGSMDPAEIPAYVGALFAGADVAKGSRCCVGAGSEDLTWLRSTGNRALTVAGNLLYRQRWSELCYGYAAFWRDAIPALALEAIAMGPTRELTLEEELAELVTQAPTAGMGYGQGFEIETILFTRAARAGLRITEVASWEYSRQYGASNLNTFRDGWRVLKALIRERCRSVPAPCDVPSHPQRQRQVPLELCIPAPQAATTRLGAVPAS